MYIRVDLLKESKEENFTKQKSNLVLHFYFYLNFIINSEII